MLVGVLIDLAAICQKLSESSALPEDLRGKARQLVEEFNLLLPYRGKGTEVQHFHGEKLLEQMARFLPRVLEVQAEPAVITRE
jgi:hypothetical protein